MTSSKRQKQKREEKYIWNWKTLWTTWSRRKERKRIWLGFQYFNFLPWYQIEKNCESLKIPTGWEKKNICPCVVINISVSWTQINTTCLQWQLVLAFSLLMPIFLLVQTLPSSLPWEKRPRQWQMGCNGEERALQAGCAQPRPTLAITRGGIRASYRQIYEGASYAYGWWVVVSANRCFCIS